MGGASWRCPHCGKWFTAKHALREHLKALHGMSPRAKIEGTGDAVEIVEPEK